MHAKTLVFFILFFIAFASGQIADAQTSGNVLPTTPVSKIAAEFFRVLNTGEEVQMSKFLQAAFSETSLKETSAADRLKFFQRLHKQSGGVTPMIVSNDSNERFLVVDVKSLKGNEWARMFFILNREQTGKLNEIGIFGIRDPDKAKANAWPETVMTEAAAIKEIDARIAGLDADDAFSGVVLIAKGERILFQKTYGMAEKAHAVRNRIDTKFNLASMNKMFTALAIAQLVEAGKLSFEDTIGKVLPEYPNKEVAAKIKVSHLLTHSSGLGDFFDSPDFRPFRDRYRDPQDYFKLFADRPLHFEPGARFSYSNAGFVVLGAIVGKASGMNYFDYIRERIYKPAGMTASDSYELTEVVSNLAVGYGRFEDDPMGIDPRRSNIAFLPWKGSPAGGGYSTADLLRFANALRANKLVSDKMRDLLVTAKLQMIGSYRPGSYGYGFLQEEFSGKTVYGHGGGGANSGINSSMKIFADGSYTIIVMGNYDSPAADDLSFEIARLLAKV